MLKNKPDDVRLLTLRARDTAAMRWGSWKTRIRIARAIFISGDAIIGMRILRQDKDLAKALDGIRG